MFSLYFDKCFVHNIFYLHAVGIPVLTCQFFSRIGLIRKNKLVHILSGRSLLYVNYAMYAMYAMYGMYGMYGMYEMHVM